MPLLHLSRQFHEWNANIYVLSGVLKGHDGPINSLSFNSNGSLLASGGDDERVRIWDMNTFRQCQTLMNPQGRWGQITCLKFINFETPAAADWLCFGTGRGMIALYRKSRKASEFTEMWHLAIFSASDSVESLTFDPGQQRLAVGSHYGWIKVLRYQNGKFVELWADELHDAIPRALLFTDNGRSLTIFTLETGAILCRDAETSVALSTRHLKTPIGHVVQCQSTGHLLVDNMQDGFDLYAHNRAGLVRTYRIEMSRIDHGRLYVFATGEEQVKQQLIHGRRQDLVQVVEAMTSNGFHVIVSGASSGKCDIRVWKKPIKGLAYREKRQLLETLVTMNVIFLLAFMWMTRETWGQSIKINFGTLSERFLDSKIALTPTVYAPDQKAESRSEKVHSASVSSRMLHGLGDAPTPHFQDAASPVSFPINSPELQSNQLPRDDGMKSMIAIV